MEESGCSIKPEIEISEEEAKNLRLQAKIETQIDFESLIAEGYSEKYLDLIVKTICEIESKAPNSKSKISGVSLSTKEVVDKFDCLTKEQIAYVLDTLEVTKKTTRISNLRSYLRTMLYNADEFTVLNESCKNESCNIEEKKRGDKSYDISKIQMLDYIDSI